uniref:fimbrial protein n=1 Tax=Halomonas sp. TaxID=1486246 RepID=UPI0026095D3D|nr:fimbrial protein [Halomonas sp.]
MNAYVNKQIDGSSQPRYSSLHAFTRYSGVSTICNCPTYYSGDLFFTATASQPEADGWLKLNDNLSARVIIDGHGISNQQVPFFQVRSSQSGSCPSGTTSYGPDSPGTDGQIELRVDRNFLGESNFSGELARIYRQYNRDEPSYSHPFIRINGNFTIKTTQNCSFRVGDTFTVDLGSTPINQLNVGAPPDLGYIPRQIDLSVDCANISDNDVSELEFFATAAGTPDTDGPYIATSKPGIGVAMMDTSGSLMKLGVENRVTQPLQGGSAQKQVRFYPTIVPGQKSEVTPGPYNAAVTITVTLP